MADDRTIQPALPRCPNPLPLPDLRHLILHIEGRRLHWQSRGLELSALCSTYTGIHASAHVKDEQYVVDVEQYVLDVEQYVSDVEQYVSDVEQYVADVEQYMSYVEHYEYYVEQNMSHVEQHINHVEQ